MGVWGHENLWNCTSFEEENKVNKYAGKWKRKEKEKEMK